MPGAGKMEKFPSYGFCLSSKIGKQKSSVKNKGLEKKKQKLKKVENVGRIQRMVDFEKTNKQNSKIVRFVIWNL